VTQRGNRRQQTFFGDEDYAAYRELIADSCRSAGVAVWGYCLMPNHVHLILVPADEDGLRAALAEAHRRYSRASTSARAGAAICGRDASPPPRWTGAT
jgi:putative transposase